MRVVFALFAALFLFAAVLQYNDAAPLPWMLMYGAAGIVAALAAAQRRIAGPLSWAVGLIAAVWAISYLPAVLRHGQVDDMFDQWTMKNQEVVENREMFGLLLVTALMIGIAWWTRARGPRP